MPTTIYITSGFTMVPNKVLFDPALSHKALKLFEVLEHLSGGNKTCWAGYAFIAEKVGCSVKWLTVLIEKLVKAGYLDVQSRPGQTNIYTLLLRVERPKRPTHELSKGQPRKQDTHNQKQTPKTNIKGGQPPVKGGFDLAKYLPGGKNAHLVAIGAS